MCTPRRLLLWSQARNPRWPSEVINMPWVTPQSVRHKDRRTRQQPSPPEASSCVWLTGVPQVECSNLSDFLGEVSDREANMRGLAQSMKGTEHRDLGCTFSQVKWHLWP